MGNHPDLHTWNMFKRREEGDLWCAVPVEAAVPRFLFTGEWDFSGHHPELTSPPGFQQVAARHSARMNGFYIFQVLRAAS